MTLTTVRATDFFRNDNGWPLIRQPDGKVIAYDRSSAAAKLIEDTYNIQRWDRRNRAYGMAYDLSLVARVLAVGGDPSTWDDAQKNEMNEISDAAAGVAQAHKSADIGSAVHALTERTDRGEKVIAGPYEADIEAYVNALIAAGFEVDPLYIECRLVCDELRLAGTADRILTRSSDRMRFIADLKTGASVDYGGLGWGAQLAAYAHSLLYDVDAGERLPTPAIDKTTGIIIHLPAGQGVCTLYEIDLVAGYRAAVLANEIRAVRREARRWISPLVTVAPVNDSRARHPSAKAVAIASQYDEGDTIDDERYTKVFERYTKLDKAGKEWASAIELEARQAGVGFRMGEQRTFRRYWLYAALILLAEDGVIESDFVRALAARATESDAPLFPTISVGKAVGSMGVAEARRFCEAAAELRAGRLRVAIDDGPELLRLVPT